MFKFDLYTLNNAKLRFQGKAGLMSRLFGSVDTEEVRELKILQLEQRIAQHDETVKQVDEDLK